MDFEDDRFSVLVRVESGRRFHVDGFLELGGDEGGRDVSLSELLSSCGSDGEEETTSSSITDGSVGFEVVESWSKFESSSDPSTFEPNGLGIE